MRGRRARNGEDGEVPPYAADRNVGEALDEFLALNGFRRDEYAATTYWVRLFGRKIRLPNPKSRRVMVPLHDLHHIATGYDTDLRSEAEIGAWELGAGCTTAMLWTINLIAAIIGIFTVPARTIRAFRAGRRRTTLYRLGRRHEELLGLSVGELRRMLGVPAQGLASS